MRIVRIPKRFYDDCEACETETPPIVRETKRHYFINLDCEPAHLADFISRAKYYSDPFGFSPGVEGIIKSAQFTLTAIRATY
jgi:hypothetical protein